MTDAHLCDAGTPEDAERRAEKCIDSPHLRWRIARARKLIFKKGCLVKSKSVGELLDAESLNPIEVRPLL